MRRPSLLGRMLATQVFVVLVGGVAATLAALLIAPDLRDRMAEASDGTLRYPGLTALATGLAVALLVSLLAHLLLNHRVRRALDGLTAAAEDIAGGRYDTPVPRSGLRELDTVAATIDALAARVRNTEDTRRRMLTDLSHELKTPISAINVSLEALEDGVLPADASTWESMRRQTSRLSRLVGDVREVSAIEEGRFVLNAEVTDLACVVRSVVDGFRPAYDAAGTRLELGQVLAVRVDVDVARLEQVFVNLLRNALQHAPGGRVEVSMERDERSVSVAVADDGVGIAPDEMPLLFERFYRGHAHARHDQGEGTGIGLSISRSLIRSLGGNLRAESDGLGHGATFVATLPVA